MSQIIEISLDDLDGKLVELPIVDQIHRDPGSDACLVPLVPSEWLSRNGTEVVALRPDDETGPAYRRVEALLGELGSRLGSGAPPTRAVHSGGADFCLHFPGGRVLQLSDAGLSPADTLWAIHRLQDLARAAEIAFALRSRSAA